MLYADLGLPLDPRVNSECVEVRRIIEVQAIRLACERRTEDDLAHLHANTKEFLKACATPTIASDLDYRFHIGIFRATQNDILLRLVTPFYIISRTRRERFFDDPARCKISHKQHLQMLDAITRRAAGQAEKLMASHIGRVEQYFGET